MLAGQVGRGLGWGKGLRILLSFVTTDCVQLDARKDKGEIEGKSV